MDFFRPNINNGKDETNQKLTGANITKSTEERLQNLKEKRKERREKINEKSSYFTRDKEENSILKETEALRKNKSLTRKEYRKQERRDISRLGLNRKK